jgi:hypothetical protein
MSYELMRRLLRLVLILRVSSQSKNAARVTGWRGSGVLE